MSDPTQDQPEGQTQDQGVKAGTNIPQDAPPAAAEPGDWREKIPEQYREAGFWKNVKDESDLFTQFAELQKYRGQSIKLPGENEGDDAWQSIYNKLGRPEDPDGYQITMRDFDGKVQWEENSEGWLKQTAHKLGLNTKQTQGLVDAYGELILETNTAYMQQQAQQVESLKEQFGDLYERKVTLGERALAKAGGQEFAERAKELGLLTDPVMLQGIIRLGSMFEESNFIDGRVGSMSRGEAKAKLDAIKGDMSHPYWVGNAPGHDAAVKEVMSLEDLIYGN